MRFKIVDVLDSWCFRENSLCFSSWCIRSWSLEDDVLEYDVLEVDILEVDVLEVDVLEVDVLEVDQMGWPGFLPFQYFDSILNNYFNLTNNATKKKFSSFSNLKLFLGDARQLLKKIYITKYFVMDF